MQLGSLNDGVGPVDRTQRGTGSALRRAYPAPGAAPDEMLQLLRQLDDKVSRTAG